MPPLLFLHAATAETEPGLSLGETTKRVAAMWKELSEDEKKPYHVSGWAGVVGGVAGWWKGWMGVCGEKRRL